MQHSLCTPHQKTLLDEKQDRHEVGKFSTGSNWITWRHGANKNSPGADLGFQTGMRDRHRMRARLEGHFCSNDPHLKPSLAATNRAQKQNDATASVTIRDDHSAPLNEALAMAPSGRVGHMSANLSISQGQPSFSQSVMALFEVDCVFFQLIPRAPATTPFSKLRPLCESIPMVPGDRHRSGTRLGSIQRSGFVSSLVV